MKTALVFAWLLWTLAAALVGIVAWAFVYYRPTIDIGGHYVNPRTVDYAAIVVAGTMLFILGFGLKTLLRR